MCATGHLIVIALSSCSVLANDTTEVVKAYPYPFNGGISAICVADNPDGRPKWIIIDSMGGIVADCPPDTVRVDSFRNGVSPYEVAKRKDFFLPRGVGLLSSQGDVLIVPQYDAVRIGSVSHGLVAVAVEKEGKLRWGFAGLTGKIVINLQYLGVGDFCEGLCAVEVESGWTYIDTAGRTFSDTRYVVAGPFREGLAAVQSGTVFGYIDPFGKEVIESQFRGALRFNEGLAPAMGRIGNSTRLGWGYIDNRGRWLVSPQFRSAEGFNCGRAVVNGDTLIERGGRTIAQFKSARGFADGLAAVQDSDGGWSYINLNGEKTIAGPFDWASSFSGQRAWVGRNNEVRLIDVKGDVLRRYRQGFRIRSEE